MIFAGMFLICLHLAGSQKTAAQPEIINATADKEESLGGTAEFSCTILNSEPKEVIWSKINGIIPIYAAGTKLSTDERISASVDSRGVTTLRIINVTNTDAGVYQCGVAHGNDLVVSQKINLKVKFRPFITDLNVSRIDVRTNDNRTLECNVTGYPHPTITWKRKNNAPLPTGGVTYNGTYLRIVNASREFAGTYYCKAENAVGEPVTKEFYVEVRYPPDVQIKKSRVGQALKYNVTLECNVWANPSATIVWMRNGTSVSENQYLSTSYDALDNNLTTAKLMITAIDRSQYGLYTCAANNSLGKNSATVEFFETSEEQCPTTCGSSLDQPDFRLLISTSMIVAAIFVRW